MKIEIIGKSNRQNGTQRLYSFENGDDFIEVTLLPEKSPLFKIAVDPGFYTTNEIEDIIVENGFEL